ncbi:MAG: hypothetical protein ACPGWR_28655 [Ardenticatenaceae bacterium]
MRVLPRMNKQGICSPRMNKQDACSTQNEEILRCAQEGCLFYPINDFLASWVRHLIRAG